MPTRPSRVSATGSWKAMPKAKISFITRTRYSPTRASSWIGSAPGAARRLEAQEEPPGQREDEVVDERAADEEQDRRGDQERQEGLLLVAVQAGRDEHPELGGDEREGEEGAGPERDLDIGEERLGQAGVDHPPAGLPCS